MEKPIPVNKHTALELISLNHLDKLYELVDKDRTYLRRWLPWLDMINCRHDERKYINYYRNRFKDQAALTAVIKYKGEISGVISMNYVDWQRKTTALGYWLGEDYQGLGIMSSSCRTMIDYCFNILNLHRINILCAAGNDQSQRIPQKLGFTKEGCLRQSEWLYDHYVDLYIFSMLQSEWRVDKRNSSIAS